ncbi:MAG: response regulator [Dehalococcoidales bacterium]|nr:response regulator [Dehalococcoidales bacterium]
MMKSGTHKKRILIVDDEPAICQFCQRFLIEEGFKVDCAADGRSAQSMIGEREYDLYLFDIKMPLFGGKDLYKWFRETYPLSAAKVVFITGSALGQETETFLQSSGRQVLLKPFTTEELKTIIGKALKEIDK